MKRQGFTLIELLVVIAIIAVLLALILPAIQMVRLAALRTQSSNNLKQLALASVGYHDANGYLPYNGATTVANNTNPGSGSWVYQILPYVEQNALYESQTGTFPSSWSGGLPVISNPLRGRPGYVSGSGMSSGITEGYASSGYLSGGTYIYTLDPNGAIGWSLTYTVVNPATASATVTGTYATLTSYTSKSSYTTGQTGTYSIAPGGTFTTPPVVCNYNNMGEAATTGAIPGATNRFWVVIMTTSNPTVILGGADIPDGANESFFTAYPPVAGPATDYGINPYLNNPSGTINAANARIRLISISDGTSNTILAGEMYYALSDYPLTTPSTTMAPIFSPGTLGTGRNSLGDSATAFLQDGTEATSNQWGSPMTEGALMAMCDGSVHLFPYSTSLASFLTPNGGEAVELP